MQIANIHDLQVLQITETTFLIILSASIIDIIGYSVDNIHKNMP